MRYGDVLTRLSGQSGLEIKLQALQDKLNKVQILESSTVQVEQKTNGVMLSVKPRKGGGSTPPGTTSRALLLTTAGDYWTARLVSDGSIINVAKPWKLRTTPFNSQTISYTDEDGNSYTETYSYLSDIRRNVVVNSATDSFVEPQCLIPRIKFSFDYIFVSSTEETGVTDAPDWIDINNDGRYWAKI